MLGTGILQSIISEFGNDAIRKTQIELKERI